MPETTQQHGDHQVAANEPNAATVAAQADVEIVAQPARQRDMPAPPEILQRGGPVWLIEIAREAIAEQRRQPHRHIGIGREIAVDLHGIAIGTQREIKAGLRRRIKKGLVHQTGREFAGHDRLLEQPPADQDQRGRHHAACQPWHRLELRHQVAGAHDRAGDEVGEKAHQQRDVEEAGRRRLAAGDIDQVAHALEREEADANRQDDFQHRQIAAPAGARKDGRQLFKEEAEIFEEPQYGEIGRHADAQPGLSAAAIIQPALNGLRTAPVDRRRRDQQRHEAPIPEAIENPTGQQQDDLAPLVRRQPHRPDEQQHRQEEQAKIQRGEQH